MSWSIPPLEPSVDLPFLTRLASPLLWQITCFGKAEFPFPFWLKQSHLRGKNCRRKFALSHSTQQQTEDGQAPCLNLGFFLPVSHSPPPSPALAADAQSPVRGVETSWGGTCLFHGPNEGGGATISPLSHVHHAPTQPPPRPPAPGTFPQSGEGGG